LSIGGRAVIFAEQSAYQITNALSLAWRGRGFIV